MRDLYLVNGTIIVVDASPSPASIAARIHKSINSRYFSFQLTTEDPALTSFPAFQGMEHLHNELATASGITSKVKALAFLTSRGI
jgi:hypothetical protein